MSELQLSDTGFPPTFINAYIVAQLNRFGILGASTAQLGPIFPTRPGNIDEVYSNWINSPEVSSPLFIQYERLMRFRPSPMYRHKREQIAYYLYSADQSTIFNATRVIFDALDREDAAAQDVNQWLQTDQNAPKPQNVFFHNFKVYVVDESRDVVELSSARTILANKIIVEYDYHTKTPTNYPYN